MEIKVLFICGSSIEGLSLVPGCQAGKEVWRLSSEECYPVRLGMPAWLVVGQGGIGILPAIRGETPLLEEFDNRCAEKSLSLDRSYDPDPQDPIVDEIAKIWCDMDNNPIVVGGIHLGLQLQQFQLEDVNLRFNWEEELEIPSSVSANQGPTIN